MLKHQYPNNLVYEGLSWTGLSEVQAHFVVALEQLFYPITNGQSTEARPHNLAGTRKLGEA